MKNSDLGVRFIAVVVVLAMAPTLAMAYIDPGSGAYMVQALFALVGAALFYLRHPVRSLRASLMWVLRRHKSDTASRMPLPAVDFEDDGATSSKREPAPREVG